MIDLHILPKKAQNELIDFYKFLVDRYVTKKNNEQETSDTTSERINTFFDGYNIDLSNFRFSRDKLYDR